MSLAALRLFGRWLETSFTPLRTFGRFEDGVIPAVRTRETIVGVEDIQSLGYINHVVTLLRNNRALKNVSGINIGYEFFIDPRFIRVDHAYEIRQVLNTLFGTDPDRAFFNFRMHTLLTALQNTSLVQPFLTGWPRITYDLNGTSFFSAAYGINRVSAFPDAGEEIPTISVIGDIEADNGRGRLMYSWLLKVYESAGFWVDVTNVTDNSKITYDASNKAVPLHSVAFKGNALNAYFESAGAHIPLGTYTINGLGRPTEDLADIYQRLVELSQSTLDVLFAGSEPASLLGKDLFYNHRSVAYRVAGALLALVYKLDAARGGASTFNLPDSVTLITPTYAEAGVSLTAAFSWSRSQGATAYRLEVATDFYITDKVLSVELPIGTLEFYMPVDVLSLNTIYYWRVMAISADGEAVSIGAPWRFST